MRKSLVLAITLILIVSNLFAVRAYIVDSITKPSAPQFTVRIIAYPYDVPPKTTTTIDQYTGKETTTTQPGYHVENKSIEITIKNQPFTPFNLTQHTGYNHETGESYTVNRNSTVNLFYNIGVKGHFGNENDWKSVGENVSYWEGPQPNAQLDSQYTTISIKADYPGNAVLDFRVKTLIGYYIPYGRTLVIFGYDFYGQESDWSIQTLYMSDGSPSPSNSPTATPTFSPSNPPTPTSTIIPTTSPSPTANLIPKPSIPTFTVNIEENNTIQLSIENQPFDVNNSEHNSLVYDVRIKTDNQTWITLYNAEDGYPNQSNSSYTILHYVLGEIAYYPSSDYPLSPSTSVGTIPTSGQVDFQVRAMIGHRDRGIYSEGLMPYVFKGEYSEWSNTQTITLPITSPSPMPSTTIPEYPACMILLLALIVTLLTIVIIRRKNQ